MKLDKYIGIGATMKNSLQKKDLKFALKGIKVLFDQLIIDLAPLKSVECPLCGYRGYRFDSAYYYKSFRKNAFCPNCGCAGRHRLLALYLTEIEEYLPKKMINLLEIAPTKSLSSIFQRIGNINHIKIDLHPEAYGNDVIRCDITESIPFPNDYFDIILCYHVLEHIQNDKRAMSNLRRVLCPSGFGIFQVPIEATKTVEYGFAKGDKCGHVRAYGIDYYDRLREQGFSVELVTPKALEDKKDIHRYGLFDAGKLTIVRKKSSKP